MSPLVAMINDGGWHGSAIVSDWNAWAGRGCDRRRNRASCHRLGRHPEYGARHSRRARQTVRRYSRPGWSRCPGWRRVGAAPQMAPPPSPTRVEAGLPSLLAQWFLAPQMFPQILLDPLLTGSPNAKAPASAGAFAICGLESNRQKRPAAPRQRAGPGVPGDQPGMGSTNGAGVGCRIGPVASFGWTATGPDRSGVYWGSPGCFQNITFRLYSL